MLRRAAVAGFFYPGEAEQLRELLKTLAPPQEGSPQPAKAVVVPHAGYIYSGRVAAATYQAVRLPRRFILLCPNHTGQGAPISIMSEGHWETPLGNAAIDAELAARLKGNSFLVQECPSAHRDEHALEVHLPFLQYFLGGDFRFVPLSVGTGRLESLLELGEALAETVESAADPVLLVSSTDMNHFESAERTMAKDQLALDRILELDPEGLHRVVQEHRISMCGFGPTVAVLEAVRRLQARRVELIAHTHSGEVTGETQRVVGYAGLVIR